MTSNQIIKRAPKAVYQCTCGRAIVIGETEVDGRLYVKNGVPICAVCRIMKAPNAGRIRADKHKVKQDVLEKRRVEQKKELDRVMGVAAESQANATKLADADRPRIIIK